MCGVLTVSVVFQELLYNNSLSVSGAGIEKTGFKYTHPQLGKRDFEDIMHYFQAQGLFPKLEK